MLNLHFWGNLFWPSNSAWGRVRHFSRLCNTASTYFLPWCRCPVHSVHSPCHSPSLPTGCHQNPEASFTAIYFAMWVVTYIYIYVHIYISILLPSTDIYTYIYIPIYKYEWELDYLKRSKIICKIVSHRYDNCTPRKRVTLFFYFLKSVLVAWEPVWSASFLWISALRSYDQCQP